MANPSHAVMLREISAAGDRERTGALDVAWNGSVASLFFKFGLARHVTLATADGRTLAGDDALAALLAELPAEIETTTWRRAMVRDETLDLTADELIALLDPAASPPADDAAGAAPQPDASAAATFRPTDAATVPASPGPGIVMTAFPALPLGAVLWSDAMANVVDLEVMVPLLPDCLLLLTCPEPRAAALVAGGAITDAVWMTGDQGQLGDGAARALIDARDGTLTAYRIDDAEMLARLRTLLGEPGGLVAPPPEAAAPTFNLTFAYAATLGPEAATPAVEPAAPPQPPFGPVGRSRPAFGVSVRVLASLGAYASTWQARANRELDDFDPNLPALPQRSRLSSVVAWLAALVIGLAVAAALANSRGAIHLPFGTQLTGTQTAYVVGGLACLYLVLILPFNLTAARANLQRLRSVEEHVGVPTDRRVRSNAALLMVIPVLGRLVLLEMQQRRINAIWTVATTSAHAPAKDVIADTPLPPPAVADTPPPPPAVADHDEVDDEADAPVETAPSIAVLVTETAESVTERPADEAAAKRSDEFGAIIAELDVVPVWLRLAPPQPEEAEALLAAPAAVLAAEDEGGTDNSAEPAAAPQPLEATAVEAAADEIVTPTPMEQVEARETNEFVPPRLDIDVEALRDGLREIAVKWLGADAAAPVVNAIAAARPGVDDFVYAIAAIRAMDISGHENAIVRAMAREMHYYATEVLCAA